MSFRQQFSGSPWQQGPGGFGGISGGGFGPYGGPMGFMDPMMGGGFRGGNFGGGGHNGPRNFNDNRFMDDRRRGPGGVSII